jgi:hypothetical protein
LRKSSAFCLNDVAIGVLMRYSPVYVEQMKAGNVDITLTENMLLDIWKKFVLLSGTSGMTANTRKSLGLIREDSDMRALLFKLMNETIAVGRAAGVDLPEDFATELDRSVAAFPPTMKASMANDLEAGRPLELDWLAGKVVALGRKFALHLSEGLSPKPLFAGVRFRRTLEGKGHRAPSRTSRFVLAASVQGHRTHHWPAAIGSSDRRSRARRRHPSA